MSKADTVKRIQRRSKSIGFRQVRIGNAAISLMANTSGKAPRPMTRQASTFAKHLLDAASDNAISTSSSAEDNPYECFWASVTGGRRSCHGKVPQELASPLTPQTATPAFSMITKYFTDARPTDLVRNNNMIWRQTSLITLVHCRVCCFNVFGEKLRIKQRRSKTIFS